MSDNSLKAFLKDFYEADAKKQVDRNFVKYASNFEEMYENLSVFEKYYVKERQKEIIKSVCTNEVSGKTILDCGCGEGFISLALSSRGANVLGVDLSSNKIRMAKNLEKCTNAHNVVFIVADAENLPFKEGAFDIVVLSEVIEHLPKPNVCLNGLDFVLAENGKGYVTVPKNNELFLSQLKKKKCKDKIFNNIADPSHFDPHIQSFSRKEFFVCLKECGFVTDTIKGIIFPMPNQLTFVLKWSAVMKFVNRVLTPFAHISILFSCHKLNNKSNM